MPRQNTLDSPLTGIPEAMRPVLSPTVAIRTQSPGSNSHFDFSWVGGGWASGVRWVAVTVGLAAAWQRRG
jgi:hypothetical protein